MIGHVGRPFGVQGALRARATGPTLGALAPGAELTLTPHEGPARRLVVAERAGSPTDPILRFEGVATRERAGELAGATIAASPRCLPPLEDPDTHYVRDLIGFTVMAGGRDLGRVRDVHPGPANDALAVAGPEGESDVLVPFTADAILQVDLAARRLLVRADLLDIA